MNTNIYRGDFLMNVAGYIYSYKGNKFIVKYSVKQECWGFQPLGTKKFFKTISGVGSYYEKMGLIKGKEKKQSSYRPNKVVNVESGKTLKEEMIKILVKNFVSQEEVVDPMEKISKTKVYSEDKKKTFVKTEYEGEYPSDKWVDEIFEYLTKTKKAMTPTKLLKEALNLEFSSMSKKQQNVWMYTKASLRTDSRFVVKNKTNFAGQEYELISLA